MVGACQAPHDTTQPLQNAGQGPLAHLHGFDRQLRWTAIREHLIVRGSTPWRSRRLPRRHEELIPARILFPLDFHQPAVRRRNKR